MPKDKLTPKQKKFCDEYLKLGNATQAAKNAGYSEKTAYRTGADNLRVPHILDYINARQEQIASKDIADIEEIMKELNELEPAFIEVMPSTLEEVFISKMEGVGYGK